MIDRSSVRGVNPGRVSDACVSDSFSESAADWSAARDGSRVFNGSDGFAGSGGEELSGLSDPRSFFGGIDMLWRHAGVAVLERRKEVRRRTWGGYVSSLLTRGATTEGGGASGFALAKRAKRAPRVQQPTGHAAVNDPETFAAAPPPAVADPVKEKLPLISVADDDVTSSVPLVLEYTN